MSEQKYMLPLAYFEPTPAEVKALQKEAADLHATVDARDSSWVDRTRATERLKDVERKIQTWRMARRQAEQQVQQQRHHAAPVGLIRSDCGTAYLRVQNAAEPQFAEPVRYYA